MSEPEEVGRGRRAELIASLQQAIGTSRSLAMRMLDDPLVSGETRALLARLDAIKAEVDLLSITPRALRPVNDVTAFDISSRLWI